MKYHVPPRRKEEDTGVCYGAIQKLLAAAAQAKESNKGIFRGVPAGR